MDGVSAAASIIAVLQLAGSVIAYLNDVQDAPKECRKCMIDISNSNTLLLRLDLHTRESQSDEPWFQEVKALTSEHGVLAQYKQALQALLRKVEPSNRAKTIARALLWVFVKDDVSRVQTRLDRLLKIVNVALEMDHL